MSKNELLQEQIQTIQKMLKKPENRLCADCKRPSPSWASINLGVFVCINCSGCHREIGVHVTKIKSINLDLWDKKILKYFKKINNKIANKYWEYHLKNFDFKKIQKDNYLCQDFIRDKYERKKWINKKKKDPMSLIIAGKFKNDSSDEEENENEEEEEEEEEKEKKNKKKNKKKKEKSDDEDSIDNDNNDNDDEFQEVEDNNNNINNNNNNINNKRPNLGLKIDLVDLNSQSSMSQRGPSKNIFNTMQNISSNNNLLDFNEVTQQDQKSNNLLNNIQQAYQTPINNNYNNRTVVNNQNNNFGIYNNNINMNNNTMNMNNGFNNFGMNNQFSNNGFINNNGNNMINMNNNFNNKPQNNQINTQPAFNMEYFQKELNQSKTNKNSSNFVLDLGSNSTRKVKDPFSNLVNFN